MTTIQCAFARLVRPRTPSARTSPLADDKILRIGFEGREDYEQQ